MIIDYLYFIGKINLPQTGNADGLADVNGFIENYEPEYLQKVLGYDLWKAFTDGIAGSGEPDARWIALLEGAEFTYSSRSYKWPGFLGAGTVYNPTPTNTKHLVVGRGQQYDPVAGLVFTLPPQFVGVYFEIDRRSVGTLRPDEYTVVGNEVTLELALLNTETVTLRKGAAVVSATSGAGPKISSISQYVYYQIMEAGAQDTVQVGASTGKTDNAIRVSPAPKMIEAWNKMVDLNILLWNYLNANRSTYPEWKNEGYSSWYWPGYSWWDRGYCHRNKLFNRKNALDL